MMKRLLIGVLFLLVTACVDKASYTYLMQHPPYLKKQMAICQAMNQQTDYCKTVLDAAINFSALVDTERQNPEEFGEHIMKTEVAMVNAKQACALAKKNYQTLLSNASTPPAALEKALATYNQAKKDYHDLRNKTKELLVTVGVNSPE